MLALRKSPALFQKGKELGYKCLFVNVVMTRCD